MQRRQFIALLDAEGRDVAARCTDCSGDPRSVR